MADGRQKNGGARDGAGRKPNRDEKELQRVLKEACSVEQRVTIFRALTARAQAGDTKAAALLLGYIYGKPVERQEVSGTDGAGIKILVEHVRTSLEAA